MQQREADSRLKTQKEACMVLFNRFNLSALAAGGALVALIAALAPAHAEDPLNLGPVGPHEPILVKMGDKRMIAYYEPNGGNCFVSAVVFDASPSGGGFASTRIRVAVHPGELFRLEGVEDRRVVLLCSPNADKLTVLNRTEVMRQAASNFGE
jgi:hypothetical protein